MEFIENTLGGVLDDLSKHNPNGWAVRYTDRNYFRTWKELNDEADLIARGMMSLGVKKGDHVAIWATNTPEWILTLFAAAKIGAVLVTVNTNFKIFELEYLLRQSDTKLLVMIGGFKNNDYVATVNELLPELKTTSGEIESEHLPFLKRVVFAGKETPEGMLNFEDLKILGGDFPVEIYEENKKNAEHPRRREYAIYLGHDRLSEGRNAHALQYPEQRQNHRRRYEIYKKRQTLHHRSVFPLLRTCACDDGVHYSRHDDGARRKIQPRPRHERNQRRKMHGGARRTHDVHRNAGTRAVQQF